MWFHLWSLQISLFYLPLDRVEFEDFDELIDFKEFTDLDGFTWFLTDVIDFLEFTEDFYEITDSLSYSSS